MWPIVILSIAFYFVSVAVAEPVPVPVTINTEAKSPYDLTAAVPLLKIRQGEKFRLFDGAAGGFKWSPFYQRGDMMKDFHVDALVMVSSYDAQTIDAAGNISKDQLHILSAGVVVGINWFQIGFGRDLVSSEAQDIFDKRKKNFFMLNLGAAIKF